MEIEVKTPNLVKFANIPMGGVFRSQISLSSIYYIKINTHDKNNNALSLENNNVYTLDANTLVISVKAKVVIED